jgi:hypothetical protein
MSKAARRSRNVLWIGGLAVAACLAPAPRGSAARADERPKTSSAKQVPVQGGGGVEPAPGAPPAITPSLESRPVAARLGSAAAPSRAATARSSLRALSMKDGEATVERDGIRETVRPGSRLGGDIVKSVSAGRLVLDRPPAGKKPAALVIVTFADGGRARERVFWTADPTIGTEAKRP